jgi:hypothetical protein
MTKARLRRNKPFSSIEYSVVIGDSIWDLLAARRARALVSGCYRVVTVARSWNVPARIVFITIRRICCGIWMRLACAVLSEF